MQPQAPDPDMAVVASLAFQEPPKNMDAHTYPGQGLSLLQLVFTLNQRLKYALFSPSYMTECHCDCELEERYANLLRRFTVDEVSELDRGISTALATICEWKNSFIHMNRAPLDILFLIPTYLHSQNDCLRASFVCRHWHRTFLRHARLWSKLTLSKGKDYVKTLLKHTKQSLLDVIIALAMKGFCGQNWYPTLCYRT
jgi:hypothetical protein